MQEGLNCSKTQPHSIRGLIRLESSKRRVAEDPPWERGVSSESQTWQGAILGVKSTALRQQQGDILMAFYPLVLHGKI